MKVKILFGVIATVAFFFALGNVGAMETNNVSLFEGTVRMCISLAVFVASFIATKKV